jgi:hypothetical protein
MCGSTCFGRLHAHHQELTTALTASGFTLERGGSSNAATLLVNLFEPLASLHIFHNFRLLTTSLSGVQDGFHPEHQTAS